MRLGTTGCVALVLLACAWQATGCGKNPPAEKQAGLASETRAGSNAAQPQAEDTTPQAEDTTAQVDSLAEGPEVTLAGTLGCGHCTYHVTTDCSPCIKTAAGSIYVIDGAGEGSELMDKRFDALAITVVGTVLGSDEPKHVAMTSYEFK